MGQVNLTFSNKNIDPKDHILSVFIETDSFVYGVFDMKQQLVASAHYSIGLNEETPFAEIEKDPNIQSNYKKTIIAYSSREFVHLNELDYKAGDFEVYFDPSTVAEELLVDKFTDSEVHIVFSVNRSIREQLIKLLEPTSEIHVSTALRQYIYPSQSNRHVALVTGNQLHYMSHLEGKLKMYNAYSYRTKEDFLYYLQLATDFTNMDRNSATLELGGWIDSTSDLYKFITPYYRHVDWVKQPSLDISSANKNHAKHHFFVLYASVLCVL